MPALFALLLAAAGAGGDPPAEVSIDRPADADAVLTETSLRIRAELAAAGTASRIVVCAVDPLAGPADCPRDGTAASISLARTDEATSIFVTSKLKTGLELRRHVRVNDAEGGGDATLLAVRAVELLRDLKVEVAAARDPEEPKPLEPFAQQAGPPPAEPPRWELIAGVSTLFIPWSNQSAFDPSIGAVLGLGARLGQNVLLVAEASGPFANSLRIAADTPNGPPMEDRRLYQALGRLSLRVGRSSATEGLFAAPMIGLSYIHLRLDAPNLSDTVGHGWVPLYGFGFGYTKWVAGSVLLTAELDLEQTPDVQVLPAMPGAAIITESGPFWMALNVTAALPLF